MLAFRMLFFVAVGVGLASCRAGEKAARAESNSEAVRYEHIVRKKPRPLQIHVVRVDMRHPGIELVTLVSDDPDGAGPADSTLADPRELASGSNLVVAINTNPFRVLGEFPDDESYKYGLGRPSQIVGWSQTPDRIVSLPLKGYFNFWVDPEGRANINNLRAVKPAGHAVAGFGRLMEGGQITESRSSPLHPRSALGYDRQRRWLILVALDGRVDGYSEGMTRVELAKLMQELGCWTAINLDGGGSTILFLRDKSGKLKIMNRPSDGHPRPIPVMLGVRKMQLTAE